MALHLVWVTCIRWYIYTHTYIYSPWLAYSVHIYMYTWKVRYKYKALTQCADFLRIGADTEKNQTGWPKCRLVAQWTRRGHNWIMNNSCTSFTILLLFLTSYVYTSAQIYVFIFLYITRFALLISGHRVSSSASGPDRLVTMFFSAENPEALKERSKIKYGKCTLVVRENVRWYSRTPE